MVKGIDIFREYFSDHKDKYILIGGAACDLLFDEIGIEFRATRDLDIVLVVEALDSAFVQKFWEFIKTGQYQNAQKSDGKRQYYRFMKPVDKAWPAQLELFSRKPDFLGTDHNHHLAPIPTDESLSSLSAILMDYAYYSYTLNSSKITDDIHIASADALICLKAKAYLEMKKLKSQGLQIDTRQIKKHKLDILRLTQLLTPEKPEYIPDAVKQDIREFLIDIAEDDTIVSNLSSLKINSGADETINLIRHYYG